MDRALGNDMFAEARRRFTRRTRGITLTGYGLIVGLIAVISITAVQTTGIQVACLLDYAADRIVGEYHPGCGDRAEDVLAAGGDSSLPTTIDGFVVPPILAGDSATVTKTEAIPNGSRDTSRVFTYPGGGEDLDYTPEDDVISVNCNSGFNRNFSGSSCYMAELPVLTSFFHDSNDRHLVARWLGGSGYINCSLALLTAPDTYTEISSQGNCHSNPSPEVRSGTLDGFISPNWDGGRIFLMGEAAGSGNGREPMLEAGTLSCNPGMPGSSTSTPDVDEDCDADFNNSILNSATRQTLTVGVDDDTTDGLMYMVNPGDTFPSTNIYLANSNTFERDDLCKCVLNDIGAVHDPASVVTLSIGANRSRTTSIFAQTRSSGDPVRCTNFSSSFGGGSGGAGIVTIDCGNSLFY
ncbi:MAG: hypothetical protein Alpg2KO_18330 [Alphaproteobacteria bacterium]